MAVTLSGSVAVTVQAINQNSLSLVTGNINLNNSYSQAYTSANVSKLYTGTRTTTGETLDLTATLSDGFGNSLNFSKWMVIFIQNNDANNNITVGGGSNAANGLTNTTVIGPGGSFTLNHVTGYTVDGTHKNIAVATTGGASQSYTLIVMGT